MAVSIKKSTKIFIIAIFTAVFALCSAFCGCFYGTHPSVEGFTDRFTDPADIVAEFKATTANMRVSNGYSNGYPFNCKWSKDAVVCNENDLAMSVIKSDDAYIGAEIRTREYYSYGYFSVCMKAAKASGVISSFFTYTGHPWDEIDIEFLGKDTTRVQFNYYTNGVGGHEYIYRLGFDGSEDFHEYGFDWQKDGITWYVDGKPVYRATKDIPVTNTQIMANVWNGVGDSFDAWCGKLNENALPATAQYKWIAYKAN